MQIYALPKDDDQTFEAFKELHLEKLVSASSAVLLLSFTRLTERMHRTRVYDQEDACPTQEPCRPHPAAPVPRPGSCWKGWV